MIQASDLRPLSMRGRYAYALACVESLCTAWSVTDPHILGVVADHWQALEVKWACHWFEEHSLARDVESFAGGGTAGLLSGDQVQSLHHALHEVRLVIGRSCYAAASDTDSMESVLNVVGILARWGVAPPSVTGFARASWSGEFGHGARVTRESFAF